MKRALFVVGMTAFVVLGPACKTSETKPDPTKSSSAEAGSPIAIASAAIAAAASNSPAPSMSTWPGNDVPVTGLDDPRFNQLPLFAKLNVEKTHRPANTLTAEKVFEEVTKKYGALRNQTQLAGFTIYAGYCEKADTNQAVDLVVCEYASPEKLTKGKESALKNNVPRRQILTVKTTTVSITQFAETKEAVEQAKGIAEIVKSL